MKKKTVLDKISQAGSAIYEASGRVKKIPEGSAIFKCANCLDHFYMTQRVGNLCKRCAELKPAKVEVKEVPRESDPGDEQNEQG